MGIFNYLKSLVGVATKKDLTSITEDAERSLSVIKDQLNIINSMVTNTDVVDKKLNQIAKILLKGTKGVKDKTVIGLMKHKTKAVEDNLAYIKRELKDVSGDLSVAQLPINKATMLIDLNSISFFCDYTSMLLKRVAVVSLEDQGVDTKEFALNKDQVLLIQNKVIDYTNVLDSVGKDYKEYKKHIESLPDVHINSEQDEQMLRSDNVPGLTNKVTTNFYWSPMHGLGRIYADWSARKYHKLKEDLRELELYAAILEANEQSLSTIVLEREVESTKTRIEELEYLISKEEE